ncbi:MAG TPA: SDR family oxidoreductase [Gemmatimonadaceae bacterium]|nr:SDR family oxidoreductase [Gemmatimonadaceae bacterium]
MSSHEAPATDAVGARGGALDGRTALVTGASRGIGLAIASAFVREGARVAMVARSAELLEARAAELGARAIAVSADVSTRDDLARMAAHAVQHFGGAPDIIVNNAGSFTIAAIESIDPDVFIRSLETNLVGPFLVTRMFLPEMRARGSGHIVSIGSVADRSAFAGNGAYSPPKFGLRALHEVLRAELRGSGVRTSLISPGPTDTPLWDALDPDSRPGFTPRRQMLRAGDVAEAVLFAVTRPERVAVDELRLSPA